MIKLHEISKSFGKNIVLKNITLQIQKGDSIAFIGANGCGKTTLVEIISGVQRPSKGKVTLDENKKPEIGIQFQEGSWPARTKAIDLIKFYRGRKALKDEELKKLLNIFEIDNIMNSEIASLSGGQKQRFNCFLSIINNPEILILDELITGLDLRMQIKLTDYFEEIKKSKKITMLIVSHIPEEIEILSDRIIILENGIVYEDSNTKDVVKKYGSVRSRLTKYFKEEYSQNEDAL